MTPGEIMQLPPDDEIVMIAGVPPVRAKKARYFTDRRFTSRLLPAPKTQRAPTAPSPDDWTVLTPPQQPVLAYPSSANESSRNPGNPANAAAARHSDTANANTPSATGIPANQTVVLEQHPPTHDITR